MSSALGSVAVRQAITALRLDAAESLHVYRNGITVYAQPATPERLDEVLITLVTLASVLPVNVPVKPRFADLPKLFHPLIPLVRKWGLTDDAARTERLERASQREVATLIRKVTPLFGTINRYLDGFSDSTPDQACSLGALAECAAEAIAQRGISTTAVKRGPTAPAAHGKEPSRHG